MLRKSRTWFVHGHIANCSVSFSKAEIEKSEDERSEIVTAARSRNIFQGFEDVMGLPNGPFRMGRKQGGVYLASQCKHEVRLLSTSCLIGLRLHAGIGRPWS